MAFPFDSRRAAQAACRILNQHSGDLTFGEVVKLLYFVDRASLIQSGQPVTGDRMISMEHGPMLSRTYDLIKDEDPDPEASEVWHRYVSSRDGLVIRSLHQDEPAVYDQLSDWELAVIDDVTEMLGHEGFSGLRKLGHSLPEWRDPSGSSETIDPRLILRDAGWTDEQIEGAVDDAQAAYAFAAVFRHA